MQHFQVLMFSHVAESENHHSSFLNKGFLLAYVIYSISNNISDLVIHLLNLLNVKLQWLNFGREHENVIQISSPTPMKQ